MPTAHRPPPHVSRRRLPDVARCRRSFTPAAGRRPRPPPLTSSPAPDDSPTPPPSAPGPSLDAHDTPPHTQPSPCERTPPRTSADDTLVPLSSAPLPPPPCRPPLAPESSDRTLPSRSWHDGTPVPPTATRALHGWRHDAPD